MITFGVRQRMRNGETKICRKLPTKGSEPMMPIEVAVSGNAFVMRAESAMLPVSAIVTIGTATRPSAVLYRKQTMRSRFLACACARASGSGGDALSVGMLRWGD